MPRKKKEEVKEEPKYNEKELYSFNVEQEQEVEEKKTEKNEAGEEVTVSKKVKKNVPVRVVVRRPNRRLIEDADLYYSIKISSYIKKGILTRMMLTKKYADTGGILTEEEATYLANRYKKLAELQNEVVANVTIKKKSKAPGGVKKQGKVFDQMNQIRKEIANIESSYSSLFQHTADIKAANDVILWYSLMLTCLEKQPEKEDDEPELEDYFKGNTFEEKMEDYYKKEENPDDFYLKLRQRVGYIISFWYNGAALVRGDFDDLMADIEAGKI